MPASAPPAPCAPLSFWQHAWRLVVVWAVGVLSALVLFGATTATHPERLRNEDLAIALTLLDFLVGHVIVGLVAFRRRWPVTIAMASTVLVSVSTMGMPAWALAVLSLATRRRLRPLLAVGAVNLLAVLVGELFISPWVFPVDSEPVTASGRWVMFATSAVLALLILSVIALIGWNLGSRRELLRSWRVEAETARREQTARVAQAQLAERSRIAREMHDVLAHRLSLVAMHAGVLAHRSDLPEAERQQSAEVVRQGAHQALEELREVLGVFRLDEADHVSAADASGGARRPVEAPQPDLSDVPTLVAEVTGSGQAVSLAAAPALWQQAHTLPRSTGRHAYRVVQEALTNARKHAPGQPLRVRITGAPGQGLSVTAANALGVGVEGRGDPEVEGTLGIPSGGRGLTGMAERVQLAGGRFQAGPDDGGDFVVRATFPWPREEQ
ncbi:sensor histidine kinase [Kytococcus sp. Marseille-QA3725]